MKFFYNKVRGTWVSDCGRYRYWVQSRPLHTEPEWAAQFDDEPWLLEVGTRAEARAECEEHAFNRLEGDKP